MPTGAALRPAGILPEPATGLQVLYNSVLIGVSASRQ